MPDRATARLLGRAVALVAALAALDASGHDGPLARPPLDPRHLAAWAERRPPPEVILALGRLFGLAAGSYLLVILSIALVGCVTGRARVLRVAVRFAPRRLRPLLAATTATVALGVMTGLAGSASAAPMATGAASPSPASPVGPAPRVPSPSSPPLLQRVPPSPPGAPLLRRAPPTTVPTTTVPTTTVPTTTVPTTTVPTTTVPTTTPDPVTRTPPGPHPGPGTPPPRRRPPTHRPVAPSSRPPAPSGPVGYVVRPGDSFWSIAATRVSAADAHADTARIASYWWLLVQTNRSDLPVPGNPDLLFPGDTIRLPSPPDART